MTIDQIVEILSYHLQTRITPGGLVQAYVKVRPEMMEDARKAVTRTLEECA